MRDPRQDPQRGDVLRNNRGMIIVHERSLNYFAALDEKIDCVIYQTSEPWSEKFITFMKCWVDHENVIDSEVILRGPEEDENGYREAKLLLEQNERVMENDMERVMGVIESSRKKRKALQ